jgi:hypothetical protein
MTRGKIGSSVALVYLAGAIFVLVTFLRAPPDGLANIWIALYVFPITAIGLAAGWLTGLEFPFLPSRLGYYWGHVAYFVPTALVCAVAIRRIVGGPFRRENDER